MLINSDCKGKNEKDFFFDYLYAGYCIERVWAARYINSSAAKRGKLTEILVHNYRERKQNFSYENDMSNPQFVAEDITDI